MNSYPLGDTALFSSPALPQALRTLPRLIEPRTSWLRAGTRLGPHYVVRAPIGDGGMAQVYHGEDTTLGRAVAIKVLDHALADDSRLVARFLREARAASRIRHPNVVEVTDYGETDDGRPFMVMELLEGETLDATLRAGGPLPWPRARPILLQLLGALAAAHAEGVVHRDIKPENVIRIEHLGTDDFIKVLDFGIAKVLCQDGGPNDPLTLEGHVLGTPTHMAPEQCLGLPVDARADLYAVGILAYELLTGHPPFRGHGEPGLLLFDHLNTPVPRLRDVAPGLELPRGLEAVIRRALEKDREDRYASAQELAEELLRVDHPSPSGLLPALRRLFQRR